MFTRILQDPCTDWIPPEMHKFIVPLDLRSCIFARVFMDKAWQIFHNFETGIYHAIISSAKFDFQVITI